VSLYTQDSIERVKDAVDMVELVGARTDLRRVGTRYTGLCPFHDERTPSFSVNAPDKLYFCFGCGAAGDAIRFVQETEALDFKGALEMLSERYNVELKLEREDPAAERRRQRRERLGKLVERSADFYVRYLWESNEARRAREYLEGRGLGEEVLRAFRIGYSPNAWDKVTVAAQRDGFTREEIAAAGLGARARGGKGFYDFFRARVMFPVADFRGNVVGFGARALRDEQGPKYKNTPEGELYHKSRQLFGIDRARAAASKQGRIFVVEGYTDVLALHQVGLEEAVAVMGTAVTPEQLAVLSQTVGKGTAYLAMDADRAGRDAMLRAARAAKDRELELRVIDMPEGTDPADLVAEEGAEAFTRLVDSAATVIEFQIRRVLADSELDSPRGRDRALDEVRPLIATIPERTATRDELVSFVADRLDVPYDYVTTVLRSAPATPRPAQRDGASRPAQRPLDALARGERTFLAMCLAQGELGREYLAKTTDAHLSSEVLRLVRDHLLAHFEQPLTELPSDDPTIVATITGVVMLADEEPSSESTVRLSFLQLELHRIERELRHAQREDDFDRLRQLLSERETVRQGISHVMGEAP
jgi:DNA primase